MRPLAFHLLPSFSGPPGRRPGRRSTLPAGSSTLIGTSPPSLRHEPVSLWQQLMCWLMAPAPAHATHPINRLPGVRAEFVETLADVSGDDADTLRNRIALSRSLRELWHLRADLYRVVGVARSQSVAQQRLTRLNRHFPARAPRSQFGGL